MAKPTEKPSWMTGYVGPNVVEPTEGNKEQGFLADERPPAEFFNWFFQLVSDWVDYVDEVSDSIEGFYSIYRAIVGNTAICTHASLEAALADVAIVPGSKILVLTNQVIDTTVQVTKNFIEIELASGVSLTKGAANTGIQVTATHFRMKSGRMVNFNKAIQVDAASKNCMLRDIVFAACATEVDDQSTNTSIIGCITEE